jgi:hypothetical protein
VAARHRECLVWACLATGRLKIRDSMLILAENGAILKYPLLKMIGAARRMSSSGRQQAG